MAERPEYSEIEHTADVGIAFRAPELRLAFQRAAAAAFDLMCDLDHVSSDVSVDVSVEGRPGDLEHLMVRWLSELLYLYSSEHILLSEFEVLELRNVDGACAGRCGDCVAPDEGIDSHALLAARVRGELFDPGRHQLKVELKAVTYHQLAVERDDSGWSVRIIFDV